MLDVIGSHIEFHKNHESYIADFKFCSHDICSFNMTLEMRLCYQYLRK